MPTVDQRYDEAIDLQQAGKLEEAVGKLEALDCRTARLCLGPCRAERLLRQAGPPGRGRRARPEGVRTGARRPFSFMAMSLVCQRAGRLPEAEQALGTAMEKQWAARQRTVRRERQVVLVEQGVITPLAFHIFRGMPANARKRLTQRREGGGKNLGICDRWHSSSI